MQSSTCIHTNIIAQAENAQNMIRGYYTVVYCKFFCYKYSFCKAINEKTSLCEFCIQRVENICARVSLCFIVVGVR